MTSQAPLGEKPTELQGALGAALLFSGPGYDARQKRQRDRVGRRGRNA
jgi:hypothetical protein